VDESEDLEVESPLKPQQGDIEVNGEGVKKKLDLGMDEGDKRHPGRKRKSKVPSQANLTLDLNIPIGESTALVPAGRVTSMVNHLDASSESGGASMIERLKKQKCGSTSNSRSAMVTGRSSRREQ
jgi:hypothetical protein